MLAERLRQIRDSIFGGKIAGMAARLEVPESTLRSWLSGKQTPNAVVLSRLCLVGNLSPKWLLLGEGEMIAATGDEEEFLVEDVERRLGITIYSRGSARLSTEFLAIAEKELARLIRDRERNQNDN